MSELKSIKQLEMERAAEPNFGKGISVASGFDLGAKSPLDSRLTVQTLLERDAHVTGNRAYEGMLVYVEADQKTYQLINNEWEEFGFNEEKFQQGIKPITDKNDEQDSRLETLESLVIGGEGEGIETIIADVAANKTAIAQEKLDRASADTALENKISEMDAAYKNADTAIQGRLDALEGSINSVDGKVDTLTERVTENESAISDLKDAISNKNSNTVVVDTEAEIATANSNPKVGDLAYVVSSKRAYIYKGVTALAVKSVPEGWVVFDEITSELDLADYLKIEDANSTFRKLSEKITEVDLESNLATKINNKADKTYVDDELAKKATPANIVEAVSPVNEKVEVNTQAIESEASKRQEEITRLEGMITSQVEGVSTELTEKETALKAEDTKLNNRISKFVPIVSGEMPIDTETGHVWLELV